MEDYKPLTIRNWSVEDRPREKMMASGTQSLSDAELIAILIGSGTKSISAVDLARQILHMAGNNLDRLGKFSITDLKKIKGIGQAKAISILAALELGRRRKVADGLSEIKITGSADVFNLIYPVLTDLSYEEFWVIFLNRSNKVITKRKISQGGITGTVTDIRLILKNALENLATSIILSHNHPSGNLQPSEADISITRRLKESAALMDISLLDHLIIAGKSYFSFADENMI
ncbi:MAG TPA: DNA repair protein RadC [Bacteroidales bacterium]|jgi:DNA repair protein RadC|nr:DNA repair protein RadC [Bacteroidales bacterium]